MLTTHLRCFSSFVLPGTSRAFKSRHRSRWADERGDVPGWVLITLMTAGLVLIIWGLAGPALSGVFQQAIDRVSAF
jgi:hypothetical protein